MPVRLDPLSFLITTLAGWMNQHQGHLNAHAERFVLTIKESCLEQMILFGEDALRNALHEFVAHYHFERNHQGLSNRLIVAPTAEVQTAGRVQCKQRLGGLLNYYHRAA